MTIVRGSGPGDAVVVILRCAAQDDRLSYRARGILLAVMSRPEDWRTGYRRLAEGTPEGERTVLKALRELETYGYLRRPRVHDGTRIRTEWEMSDDASRRTGELFVQPTKLQPTKLQPTKQQPTKQQPTDVQPLLSRETKKETTTTPVSTSAADPKGLAGLLLLLLEEQGARRPTGTVVRRECARLAEMGWSGEQLADAARANSWAGAGAGAVVAWLRDLERPPTRRSGSPTRPAWCGACDETTRHVTDPQTGAQPRRCPVCHPLAGGRAS